MKNLLFNLCLLLASCLYINKDAGIQIFPNHRFQNCIPPVVTWYYPLNVEQNLESKNIPILPGTEWKNIDSIPSEYSILQYPIVDKNYRYIWLPSVQKNNNSIGFLQYSLKNHKWKFFSPGNFSLAESPKYR